MVQRMKMRVSLVTLALATVLTACRDREPAAAPEPIEAPSNNELARVVHLTVSDINPLAGSTIVIAGNIGRDDSLSIASFRARLGYDGKALVYLGEAELPGMMRVVNPQANEIIVVGATAQPATDGRLFAIRFRVVDPRGLETLLLSVDELNDARFASQLASLTPSSRLQLDQKLGVMRK
jgi:hypothetical protein